MKKLKFFFITILFATWWGGFTFYSAVVVPQGMQILGDHVKMGLITKSVTNYINATGSFVLIVSFGFLLANNPKEKNYLRAISWEWFVLVSLQLLLFYIHCLLVSMITISPSGTFLQPGFYNIHRIYLLTSAAMWLLIPLLYYRLIRPIIEFVTETS